MASERPEEAASASAAGAGAATTPADLPDPDLKIITIGDSACGKTKLIERFLVNNYAPRQMSTFALTVFRHTHEVDGKRYEIDFWDTAGQERFASMHPSYYHRAHCAVLVFDVTRKVTYQHMEQWYKELQQYRPGLPTIVVANKIDVDYSVVKKSFAFPTKHQYCIPNVYFCSAADGTNVVKLFTDAIRHAAAYKANPHEDDFLEDVMETIDYFNKKETSKAGDGAADGNTSSSTSSKA